ncbi:MULTISPECIES: DUF805 domain-containing protein [Kordiimonas]|jgi:uncharacterized membrane protein YhaH (DUF805 family)|uniref:DUF805 domain-containing protein n=1 Tax=Kordiimonas TaxID=288021 RepID=UPI00257AE3A9|nr:DUF805 domain-containing protein [Kordiimonas sp. UBA4487]
MGFGSAVATAFKKYATFSGRASRSEYWWFFLFYILAFMAASFIDVAMGNVESGIMGWIVLLILFLPTIAISVRRLHDINMSGWWYLVFLVPIVGIFFMVFWFTKKGDEGDNRFGSDPLGTDVGEVFS